MTDPDPIELIHALEGIKLDFESETIVGYEDAEYTDAEYVARMVDKPLAIALEREQSGQEVDVDALVAALRAIETDMRNDVLLCQSEDFDAIDYANGLAKKLPSTSPSPR